MVASYVRTHSYRATAAGVKCKPLMEHYVLNKIMIKHKYLIAFNNYSKAHMFYFIDCNHNIIRTVCEQVIMSC